MLELRALIPFQPKQHDRYARDINDHCRTSVSVLWVSFELLKLPCYKLERRDMITNFSQASSVVHLISAVCILFAWGGYT